MITLMFLKKPSLMTRLLSYKYSDVVIRCGDYCYCCDSVAGVTRFRVTSYTLEVWDCIFISGDRKAESMVRELLDLQARPVDSFTKIISVLIPVTLRRWSAVSLTKAVLSVLGRPMHRNSTLDDLYLALLH